MLWRLSGFGLAMICAIAGGPAAAGIVLTTEQVNLTDQSTTKDMIYLDSDRMKLSPAHRIMIYRGDLDRIWMIDESKHKYFEMTPQSMQQAQDNTAAAMQHLPDVPEAQRKQIEAMMAQRGMTMPGAQPPAPIYEKAGGIKTVAGFSCELYRMRTGDRVADECIAHFDAVGLTRDDLKLFAGMKKFFGSGMMAGQANAFDFDAQRQALGFDGIPLETIVYLDGKPVSRRSITAITRSPIPPATFELPDGLTKEAALFGAPRGAN
jgi:hypothetical protein